MLSIQLFNIAAAIMAFQTEYFLDCQGFPFMGNISCRGTACRAHGAG